jgi:5'-phosphate synthase pdxT subunit
VITATGPAVEVLARVDGHAVLVRQGPVLASTFHPELSGDLRLHRLFLRLDHAVPGAKVPGGR